MSETSSEPTTSAPFWRTTPLSAMTAAEWESLCDGCGRCCLHKLEDEDDGTISYTNVACELLNIGTCRCRDYVGRRRRVPDCVQLTPEVVGTLAWLPSTCAYRLLSEGKALAWWHPLVSGDPDSVHRAGISVRGRAVPENRAGPLDHHIVDWPA
ncbi:MAG: YcgN family cysteine cluster protein [Magnetospirillum sp.]|nr:YcgN family cysteine cluster protein [Magnetospirillum sp.]